MKPTDAFPHPDDWGTTTVGMDVDIRRGVSWSKNQEYIEPGDGRIPVIRIGNVQDTLELDDLLYLSGLSPAAIRNKRMTTGWSVLVGSNGNRNRVGNAVFVKKDAEFLFASFLVAVRPKADSKLTPEYFYRWLSTEQVQAYLSASSEGTTGLNNLSHSFFRAMSIPVPPADEQAAIVHILDSVDTALEAARAAVQRARDLKRALLQRFFYSALGETAYADNPKRRLPTDWALVPTEDLLAEEPKNGVSPEASSQPPGTPTFSIAAVREGRVELGNRDNLKYARVPEKTALKYRLRRGDVLIVRGNANPDLVGKAAMIDSFPDGCIYPDITKRVVFRTEGERTVTSEFAVLCWNHAVVHNQVLRRAKTSNGTLKINSRDVKQIVMPVPPLSQQADIVKLAASVDANVDVLNAVLSAHRQLKRSLMQDLITGRVRVRHLELAAGS